MHVFYLVLSRAFVIIDFSLVKSGTADEIVVVVIMLKFVVWKINVTPSLGSRSNVESQSCPSCYIQYHDRKFSHCSWNRWYIPLYCFLVFSATKAQNEKGEFKKWHCHIGFKSIPSDIFDATQSPRMDVSLGISASIGHSGSPTFFVVHYERGLNFSL